MVHNGRKQSKMVQVVQNYQNGQKWSKGTWSKWHKTVEMVKHGGPDFKRSKFRKKGHSTAQKIHLDKFPLYGLPLSIRKAERGLQRINVIAVVAPPLLPPGFKTFFKLHFLTQCILLLSAPPPFKSRDG